MYRNYIHASFFNVEKSYVLATHQLTFVSCHFRSRSQWPRGQRHGSAAARLLGLWVRISPRAWMCVSCECCVFLGRGLFDGSKPFPEESYGVYMCVCVTDCDQVQPQSSTPAMSR